MRKGSRPSGRTIVSFGGASTTAGAPQNAQRDAASPASNVVVAPQPGHETALRARPQPRSDAPLSASSIGRSITSPGAFGTSFFAPQYGHVSAAAPGFQTTSAPHAAHGNLRSFAGAAGVAGGTLEPVMEGASAGGRRRRRRHRRSRRSRDLLERREWGPAGRAGLPGERSARDLAGGHHSLQRIVRVRPVSLAVHGERPLRRGKAEARGGGGAMDPPPPTPAKLPPNALPIIPPIAIPAPMPMPAPAAPPGFAAAIFIASAAWSCVYWPMRSPRTPSFVRWSIAASTSSGRETFSMKNLERSRP